MTAATEMWANKCHEQALEIERLTADSDALLQQALGVEAERDIARFEIERLTAENERLRKLLDAVANQGWQEIDDDLRRQIRAYQQTTVKEG